MLFFKKRSGINLIPEEEQVFRAKKIKLITVVILSAFVGLQVLGYLLITIIHLREENRRDQIEVDINQKNAEWQKVASSVADLKLVKGKLSKYQSFTTEYSDVEGYIESVRQVIPAKIKLINLKVVKGGSVELEAKAASPANILQFLNVLNDNQGEFSLVNLTSVNKNSDEGGYSFKITMRVIKK